VHLRPGWASLSRAELIAKLQSAYPVDNLKNSVLLKEKLVDGRVLDDNKEIQFAGDPYPRQCAHELNRVAQPSISLFLTNRLQAQDCVKAVLFPLRHSFFSFPSQCETNFLLLCHAMTTVGSRHELANPGEVIGTSNLFNTCCRGFFDCARGSRSG